MLTLVLFFSEGMTLKAWKEHGFLDREIDIYSRLRMKLGKVCFITYGKNDKELECEANGIKILPRLGKVSIPIFYSILIPWYFRKVLKNADIFKTNQISSAIPAVLAKIFFHKKLIVRCGYVWSLNATLYKNSLKTKLKAFVYELIAFHCADKIFLPTEQLRQYVFRRYKISLDKIMIMPNSINTALFSPEYKNRIPNRLIYVGRLEKDKNLLNLLRGLKGLLVELVVYGDGPEKTILQKEVETNKLNVKFMGRIPNNQLPGKLNEAEIFVFPSLHEGNPKSLLEAMACGLPVIACDVIGVNNTIAHKDNGYLCGTTAESLRKGILEVLNNKSLRERIGKNARQYVVENCSMERLVKKEVEVYRNLLCCE